MTKVKLEHNVEAILERHPDLRNHPELLLDLIYNEVVLREQRGEAPTLSEYMRRFPELSTAIKDQFESHEVFADHATAWAGGRAEHPARFDIDSSLSSSASRFRVLRLHATGGLGAVFVALDAEL